MGDICPKFKAAAVQAAPVFLDREATVEKACRLIEEARDNGAEYMVFPETFIPAYPYWASSVAPSWQGERGESTRNVFVQLFNNSVEVPSPATEALCRAARKARSFLVVGINEREAGFGHGTLYNTLLYIDDGGEIMGTHRKLIPTSFERLVWGRGDGSGLRVFPTRIGRLGGLICFEHHMSLSKYAMYSKGEQIHAAVWPAQSSLNPIIDAACRQYAYEGQTFVVVACGVINPELVPDTFELKSQTRWNSNGGSAIISPQGAYLGGPLYEKEGIVYADIDLELVTRAKCMVDTVGHYARPDVARLMLNEEYMAPACGGAPAGGRVADARDALRELRGRLGRASEEEVRTALDAAIRSLGS